MKAVIQRCQRASVAVEGKIVGEIERGLAIFLGVGATDDESCAARLAHKIAGLRIFDSVEGKFDLSLRDIGGAALVISNFTLYGDARKGTRPSFSTAAPPELANQLYQRFVTLLMEQNIPVQTGVFGAHMTVLVENDGPVTVLLDIENRAKLSLNLVN